MSTLISWRVVALAGVIFFSFILGGCHFSLYRHVVSAVPDYAGLETSITTAYEGYYKGFHKDTTTNVFVPMTGIPQVDILQTIFSASGVVEGAESITTTALDNTATSEVLKSKFIPFHIEETKEWFVFSTKKSKE